MSDDSGPVRPRRTDAPDDVGRRVVVRELALGESAPGVVRLQADPIDPEGAPRLSAGVPGDEVPASSGIDEPVRLDVATALGAVVTSIVDPCLFLVSAGTGECREYVGVDGRTEGGCVH